MSKDLLKIVEPLLQWYSENKRELPWRKEKNPYFIWLSEIMLQQTRIEAVKRYYEKFIKELPTIYDLANIEEEKLLKLWEGLGYYNRARNLKKAAQMIEEKYNGNMPKTYHELLTLPGIGEYTAGAIASIAYDEKVPAVDGNVLRVISRIIASKEDVLLPETKKKITKQIQSIIPKQAGDFNEALMELGELICLPNTEPICEKCPLKQICMAKQKDVVNEIPVRQSKIKRKIEEKTVFLIYSQGQKVAIQKRQKAGLLAGMYEFPNKQGKLTQKEIANVLKNWNLKVMSIKLMGDFKHVFTHIDWKMVGYEVQVENENTEFVWESMEQLKKQYALPTAFQIFLRKNKR